MSRQDYMISEDLTGLNYRGAIRGAGIAELSRDISQLIAGGAISVRFEKFQ